MALEKGIVSFTQGTTSITGFGSFLPKFALFFATGRLSDGTSPGMMYCCGAATGTSDQRSGGYASGDNVAGAQVAFAEMTARCLRITDATGNNLATAQITGWASGTITLTWNTDDGQDRIIFMVVAGGSTILNAQTGNSVMRSATGTGNITGMTSFTPTTIFPYFTHFPNGNNTNGGANAGHMRYCFGWANAQDGGIVQGYSGFLDRNGENPSVTNRVQKTDRCFGQLTTDSLLSEFSVTAFNSDGISINQHVASGAADAFHWLAIECDDVRAVSFNTNTGTGAQAVPVTGITPVFGLLQSFNNAASGSVLTHSRHSMGVGVSSSSRFAISQASADAANPTVNDHDMDRTKFLKMFTEGTPTVAAAADLTSYGADVANLDWTAVDGTARQAIGIFFGEPAATGNSGSSAAQAGPATGSGTGALAIRATSAGQAQPATGSATGRPVLSAASAGQAQPASGSSTGTLAIRAASAGQAEPATGAATARPVIRATSAGQAQPATGSATTSFEIHGSAAGQAQPATGGSTARLVIRASATGQAQPATGTATGNGGNSGSSAAQAEPATGGGTAKLAIRANSAGQAQPATGSGTGRPTIRATAAGQAQPAAGAASGSFGFITPKTWVEVPNSHMEAVAPSPIPAPGGISNVRQVMGAWSGAALDTTRLRLIVWGGGHSDYSGNEVYAFDLVLRTWSRLTDPTAAAIIAGSGDVETSGYYATAAGSGIPDTSQPRPRHTYNALVYAGGIDKFISLFTTYTYPSAEGVASTDLFDPDTNTWAPAASPFPSNNFSHQNVSDIHPTTGRIWFYSGGGSAACLYDYNPDTGVFTIHGDESSFGSEIANYSTGVIDPIHDRLYTIGSPVGGGMVGAVKYWPLGSGNIAAVDVTTTGPQDIVDSYAPGLAWDPLIQKIVGWSGGSDVFTLDTTTHEWEQVTLDPSNSVTPSSAAANGTYGRFRYSAELNLYVAVNRTNENVFLFKLNADLTPNNATSSGQAEPASGAGTGRLAIRAASAGQAQPASGSATGRPAIRASSAGQALAASGAGAGRLAIHGVAAGQAQPATGTGTTSTEIHGTVAGQAQPATGAATAQIGLRATSAGQAPAATGSGTARLAIKAIAAGQAQPATGSASGGVPPSTDTTVYIPNGFITLVLVENGFQ